MNLCGIKHGTTSDFFKPNVDTNKIVAEIIQEYVESNLKQRVVGNPNPVKLGRCFDFLKDYYEIQNGGSGFYGNRFTGSVESPNNSEGLTTQSQLANTYNVSVDTMENYIKLSKAIPEVANLVETGTINKTTALAMMKNLSDKEGGVSTTTYPKRELQDISFLNVISFSTFHFRLIFKPLIFKF